MTDYDEISYSNTLFFLGQTDRSNLRNDHFLLKQESLSI